MKVRAAVELVSTQVALSLVTPWTCRHCGNTDTPTITEFCNSCGIEDCRQGAGAELARDRRLRLAGQRGGIGLWTRDVVEGMVMGLIRADGKEGDNMMQVRFMTRGKGGRETHAAIFTEGAITCEVFRGVAKRRRCDAPDKARGRRLALGRATMAMKAARGVSCDLTDGEADALALRRQVRALWDYYYGVYEPHSLRGRCVIHERQHAKAMATGDDASHTASGARALSRTDWTMGGLYFATTCDQRGLADRGREHVRPDLGNDG